MKTWLGGAKNKLLMVVALVTALQPIFGVVFAPTASAASQNITQLAFTSATQTVEVDIAANLSVQLRNAGGTEEQTSSNGSKLQLSSSSATGSFAEGSSSTTWAATTNYSYAKNTANKSFRYKDTTPGTHTITAKVNGGGISNEVIATTEVIVNAAPVVHLTLPQRIAAAAPGDTIDVTEDEVVTGNIIINKTLTLTSSNGSTISTSGSGNLFRITAPNVTISQLNFVKTDSTNQHIVSVGANNTTISGNTFTGQYDLGDSEVTRALELSTASGYVISGNTFNHLRQPAYINDFASGSITNNHVRDTRGWVLVANTNFTFSGNTFETNAVDIAFIPGQPNTYTCEVMQQIKQANNDPVIDNQVLDIADCDFSAPSVPTGGAPHDAYRNTNEFDFTWDASTDNKPGQIKYQFRSSRDSSQVGSAPDSSGAWMSGELDSPMIHSSGAPDGKWYWQVRAIDEAGNKSAWSDVWNMTIDTVAPSLLVMTPEDASTFGDDDLIVVTSYMEDAWGLGNYFIDINKVQTTVLNVATEEAVELPEAQVSEVTDPESSGLTVIAIFNARDFANGEYVITVRVTDKAGNVTEENRTIFIEHTPVVVPGGQGGEMPVNTGGSDDDVLTQLTERLTQPFSLPQSFASSTGGGELNQQVLGLENTDTADVAGGEQIAAAVPSTEGWKLFGVAWYWWLLLAAVLGVATAWIVRRVRPGDAA
jgi:hypothetical protein